MKFREFCCADKKALLVYLNNQNVTRYLSSRIPQPYTDADADWWIKTGCKEGVVRVIEVEECLAGTVGIRFGENEYSRSAEIGYWLAEEFWGQGIATCAVSQITEYIFSYTKVIRLFAPVFSPNLASMKVLEKTGYCCEAVLKSALFKNDEFYDQHIFAQVKAQ